MTARRRLLVGAVLAGGAALLVLLPATPASAHPLGNFTVNHYDGLTLTPTELRDTAIVDSAEIPTLQERSGVDANHDGQLSAAERDRRAAADCARVAGAVRAEVGGTAVRWRVASARLEYRQGAADLDTSRLTCQLAAPAGVDRRTTVTLADRYRSDRIGWREITATGAGIALDHPPVPARSISDQLRRYPNDLLSSPLDQRSVTLHATPGTGGGAAAATPHVRRAGPASRWLSRLDGHLTALVARHRLSLPATGLALLLAALLGAAHAAMPGHGKTVMAAYLAGRGGGVRDAALVGVTVTVTHTAGVFGAALLLTASASLAGESLLAYLGVASGVLVTVIGAGLLRGALRHRRHRHDHEHDHGHHHHHHHHHPHGKRRRGGLVGIGLAGGLVPSPTALVVLLGAVALGHTALGVVLVLLYGLGMATALTAAGLLVLRVGDRLARHALVARATALSRYTPFATAGVVVAVGLGLTARGVAPLL